MRNSIILYLLFTLSACTKNSDFVHEAIEHSGKNESELLKVLKHYESPHDSLKFRAAIFLIKNMKNHFTYSGPGLDSLKVLSSALDSLWKRNLITESNLERPLKKLIDSLDTYSHLESIALIEDISFINSFYLIENIELAFEAWRTFPWAKNVPFNRFCEYILPYKVYNEPVRPWRKEIMSEFSWVKDSLKDSTSLKEATILINESIRKKMFYSPSMRIFPLAIDYRNLSRGKVGKCEHLVTYNTYVLRAMGIPAMVDYVPAWGNNSAGHTWGAIIDENNRLFTFDALYYDSMAFVGDTNIIPEGKLRDRRAPKIFRLSYELRGLDIPSSKNTPDVPAVFFNDHRVDVTSEYIDPVADLVLSVDFESENDYTYLCVYNTNSWKIIALGKRTQKSSYLFKNLGCNIIYLPVSDKDIANTDKSVPFLLTEDSETKQFKPNHNRLCTLKLKRKSFIDYDLNVALKKMIGGIFQGAQTQTFQNAKNLYEIDSVPEPRTNMFQIKDMGYYRYFRFTIPNNVCKVAELRYFGFLNNDNEEKLLSGKLFSNGYTPNGNPENVEDNDVLSYFISNYKENGFIGLDIGKENKAKVTRIEFYPPNDGNSVEVGNEYELSYWDGGWISLGKHFATNEELVYTKVPTNAIYVLKNLTKGYKQRIFTYENGTQVWW